MIHSSYDAASGMTSISVELVCPICREVVRLGQSYPDELVGRSPLTRSRPLDFSQHFRDAEHTDQQWRDAYFLDTRMQGRVRPAPKVPIRDLAAPEDMLLGHRVVKDYSGMSGYVID